MLENFEKRKISCWTELEWRRLSTWLSFVNLTAGGWKLLEGWRWGGERQVVDDGWDMDCLWNPVWS